MRNQVSLPSERRHGTLLNASGANLTPDWLSSNLREFPLPFPQIGAPDAVQQYAAICSVRARELRAAAAGQLQRAARYLALRDEVRHKQY
jgi:hypothetical protein